MNQNKIESTPAADNELTNSNTLLFQGPPKSGRSTRLKNLAQKEAESGRVLFLSNKSKSFFLPHLRASMKDKKSKFVEATIEQIFSDLQPEIYYNFKNIKNQKYDRKLFLWFGKADMTLLRGFTHIYIDDFQELSGRHIAVTEKIFLENPGTKVRLAGLPGFSKIYYPEKHKTILKKLEEQGHSLQTIKLQHAFGISESIQHFANKIYRRINGANLYEINPDARLSKDVINIHFVDRSFDIKSMISQIIAENAGSGSIGITIMSKHEKMEYEEFSRYDNIKIGFVYESLKNCDHVIIPNRIMNDLDTGNVLIRWIYAITSTSKRVTIITGHPYKTMMRILPCEDATIHMNQRTKTGNNSPSRKIKSDQIFTKNEFFIDSLVTKMPILEVPYASSIQQNLPKNKYVAAQLFQKGLLDFAVKHSKGQVQHEFTDLNNCRRMNMTNPEIIDEIFQTIKNSYEYEIADDWFWNIMVHRLDIAIEYHGGSITDINNLIPILKIVSHYKPTKIKKVGESDSKTLYCNCKNFVFRIYLSNKKKTNTVTPAEPGDVIKFEISISPVNLRLSEIKEIASQEKGLENWYKEMIFNKLSFLKKDSLRPTQIKNRLDKYKVKNIDDAKNAIDYFLKFNTTRKSKSSTLMREDLFWCFIYALEKEEGKRILEILRYTNPEIVLSPDYSF